MRSALLCHGLMLVAAPAAAQTFVHGERDGVLAQIPAPPNDSSIAGQADLDAVLLVQTIRSPSDEAAASLDADLGPADWARRALGPAYDPRRHPERFALFERARRDMTALVDLVKAKGPQRPRPAARDPRVKPSLSVAGHGANSWPSGRAAAARAWAGILSDLFPERADALSAAARRTGEYRVIGGVHYPTDLVAGHWLADAFLARLRAHFGYRAELARLPALRPAGSAGR